MAAGFAMLALVGCPSGGVGDQCIPEDEYRENFAGFDISEENIESRSFQCDTRICLVNHFQGRVSCPTGQPAPVNCSCDPGTDECDSSVCGSGEKCKLAGTLINSCDPRKCSETGADPNNCTQDDGGNDACDGNKCHPTGRYCQCTSTADCPQTPIPYACVKKDDAGRCQTMVCSKAPADLEDGDQYCHVPGTDTPIAVPVCGQCATSGFRHADKNDPAAVYCSCRCDVADGEEDDPNFNFCECEEGFECKEIRKNVGLGDKQLAGKYCIKSGSAYNAADPQCGIVTGYHDLAQCDGQTQ
jgi:hypothetical protein